MESWPNSGVDWEQRQGGWVRRVLRGCERLSLALERPVERWVRNPQLNPLYHTGPITVFLLLVILLTGVYLTLFYQFGFQASYQAVAAIESNFLGRMMRALHRYASGAAVIAALLHGWRTFFQDRFRGPRWLAWVSGVGMAALVWIIGVTGYWLIWDARAQAITQTLVNMVQGFSWGQAFLVDWLILPTDAVQASGIGWMFVMLVITLHLGLSAVVGVMLWLHVRRLNRTKWFPPNVWMGIVGGLLLVAALWLPAGMLAAYDGSLLPQDLPMDVFYLFHIPPALSGAYGLWWLALAAALAAVAAFPWLLGRLSRPPLHPVYLNEAACTGCTLCAADCPYMALSMAPRSDGKRHKYVARLDPGLCVSCGICIGACSPAALALVGPGAAGMVGTGGPATDLSREAPPLAVNPETWQECIRSAAQAGAPVQAIFTCERHAFQSANPQRLSRLSPSGAGRLVPVVIPISCVGMLHPDQVGEALDCGACEVLVAGCPPEDCANREGNLWLQQRLERQRMPKLRLAYAGRPVDTAWAAPGGSVCSAGQATAYTWHPNRQSWLSLLPPIILLAGVLILQLLLTYIPYRPYAPGQAHLEIALRHRSGASIQGASAPAAAQPAGEPDAVRLVLELDGKPVWEGSAAPSGAGRERKTRLYARAPMTAGDYRARLLLYDPANVSQPATLYDGMLALRAGQVVRLAYEDQVVGGDPQAGEALYYDASLGNTVSCRICHSLEPGVDLVGPSFAGVAGRAATRIPGMDAEAYLRQSILEPNAYIVSGFPAGQMVQNLGETLSQQQIEDLVAFLMTLK